MSPAVEKIVEPARNLSHDEWEQLWRALYEIPSGPASRPSPELITSIRGKYAHLATSRDEFIARKQEEIDLEEHRYPR